jgi:hypothetical protein
MWYFVSFVIHLVGRIGLMISSITASCRSFNEMSGLCWVDNTTASMPTGLSFS